MDTSLSSDRPAPLLFCSWRWSISDIHKRQRTFFLTDHTLNCQATNPPSDYTGPPLMDKYDDYEASIQNFLELQTIQVQLSQPPPVQPFIFFLWHFWASTNDSHCEDRRSILWEAHTRSSYLPRYIWVWRVVEYIQPLQSLSQNW